MSNLIPLSIPVDQINPTRRENSTTFCVIPDKNFPFSSSFQQTLLRCQLRYLHVALLNLTNPVVQLIESWLKVILYKVILMDDNGTKLPICLFYCSNGSLDWI